MYSESASVSVSRRPIRTKIPGPIEDTTRPSTCTGSIGTALSLIPPHRTTSRAHDQVTPWAELHFFPPRLRRHTREQYATKADRKIYWTVEFSLLSATHSHRWMWRITRFFLALGKAHRVVFLVEFYLLYISSATRVEVVTSKFDVASGSRIEISDSRLATGIF